MIYPLEEYEVSVRAMNVARRHGWWTAADLAALTRREAALKGGVGRKTLWEFDYVLEAAGLHWRAEPETFRDTSARNREIYERRRAGAQYKALAIEHGVSRTRVRQIYLSVERKMRRAA